MIDISLLLQILLTKYCYFLSNTFVLDLILRHPHYGVVAIEPKNNTQSDALMTL